jgi:hypothetical protein
LGDAINLNLHYHLLVIDGVYADAEGTKTPTFSPLPPPDHAEIARATVAIGKRTVRLPKRPRLLSDEGPPPEDPLLRDEPADPFLPSKDPEHVHTHLRASPTGRPPE